MKPKLFKSFFQGGFECSTHRRADGERLDIIKSTLHDYYALEDYLSLISHNIYTIRDGVRWHLIEQAPNYYDWSSFIPMLHAARNANVQVIWDLCHYGWPDHIDIWSSEFIHRFANFASNIAQLIKNETDEVPIYSPINEISFWSWAGGEVAYFNPFAINKGVELKRQLVLATITAIDAIRQIDPRARFVQAEPLINVTSLEIQNSNVAAIYNEAQFQTFEMIIGREYPELGGQENFLDIIGINYYPHNQWFIEGPQTPKTHPNYVSFSKLLTKISSRYEKPIFIAETGAEDNLRVEWIQYICDEVSLWTQNNSIEGICIYPIIDYHGWDDYRHCKTGLLGLVENGKRNIFSPLATEIFKQQNRFSNNIINVVY